MFNGKTIIENVNTDKINYSFLNDKHKKLMKITMFNGLQFLF